MIILGIETSCDETAAAVVEVPSSSSGLCRVLSNVVYTQIARHKPYGGVVPEIASRSHVEVLPGILSDAIEQSGVAWPAVDAVAVTCGPGLASSLLVGLAAGKALALRLERPLAAVHHLESHLFSIFLGPDAPIPKEICPFVALLVSGGHTCLVRVEDAHTFRLLGQTLDDAAGEALDKGASLLGLGYPGGPAIEEAARGGDETFVQFPRGLRRQSGSSRTGGLDRDLCFSFSGVKTALRYYVKDHPQLFDDGTLKDVAASYQEAVMDALTERVGRVLEREPLPHLACVGGVARNEHLRQKLRALAEQRGVKLWLAGPEYCTDNAAMVAALAGVQQRWVSRDLDQDVDPNLAIRPG